MSDSSNITYAYLKYLPELDYWFNLYWKDRGELTIYHVNTPESFEFEYAPASFIELLFSETFNYDYYNYGFKEVTIKTFPSKIVDRCMCKNTNVKAFIGDTTGGVEAYTLLEGDLYHLDRLYAYRNGFTFTGDSTGSIDTKLSFYIDKYLDLKINRDYSWVFSLESIQNTYNNPTILENLFEIYVLNEAHKEIKGWTNILDSNTIHLVNIRNRIKVSSNQEEESRISIPEPIPYDNDSVDVYLNGKLLDNTLYTLSNDSSSFIIAFSEVDIVEDDIMIVDYKYNVITTEV